MKVVVKWCLFLIFVNLFIPCIASLGFFAYTVEGDDTFYDLNDADIDDVPSDTEGFRKATGYEFDGLTNIGLETFGILGLSAIIGIGFMKMTRSLSPLLISLFFATFFNIWRRSSGILSSFSNNPVTPWLVMIVSVGVLVYFLYTVIEYYHQGDASDS